MKLLKLEFENVNSLAGKWSIDFADEAFAREGLFAIVGSTGAGKTSILDAISLALYGKTARQEKATNLELAEVMTRDTDVCSCKVSFLGIDGRTYRAEWKITRKTRKDSDGGVNAPSVRIYELAPERDITPKEKAEAVALIVRKVGLDFAQFQRSMMLAQGQFDKFLTASDTDRAAILAEAAGTDVFSRIGMRIFEKTQAAKQAAGEIRVRQDENKPLPPEEREKLETDKKNASELATLAKKRLDALQVELSWHREEERLTQEKVGLERRKAELEERRRNLAPAEKTLAEAEKARSLRDMHTKLELLRTAKKTADGEATNGKKRADQAEEDVKTLNDAIPSLENRLRMVESTRRNAAPVLEGASKLDMEIVKARGVAEAATVHHGAVVAERDRIARDLARLEQALKALSREKTYLETLHAAPDAEAPEAVDPSLANCAQKRAALKRQAADVIENDETARALLAAREAEFAQAQTVYNAEQPQIEARINDAMRICRVMEAMDYDTIRANLRAGDRCPVCGKPVDDIVPKDLPSAADFNKAYNEAVAAKTASDKAYNDARRRRDEADRKAKNAEQRRKAATEELERLDKELAARETQNETRIHEATVRQSALQADSEEAARKLADWAEALGNAKDRVVDLVGQRTALNLPEDLAHYKKSLDDAVDVATTELSESQREVAAATAKRDQLRETFQAAQAKADRAAATCLEAEGRFAMAIGAMGFADEAAWQAACGDDSALAEIRQRRDDLAKESAALDEARTKYDADKALHDAQGGSNRSREDVEKDIEDAESKRSAAERDSGSYSARIAADDDRRQKGAELAEELEKAEAAFGVWSRLNKLLGGKDGFRFSQYAQGLTLRALLEAANPFLAKITGGRYSLLWRPAKPADDDKDDQDPRKKKKVSMLLPLIMDHDQHDTVRPISNVSGGERFEVSLALALGLSKLNAGRVNVETMFLDEGFGTLDPERLGAALDVLCELHSDGATIGVISHIKAVEERLPLTIRVEPAGMGFGRLVGEGAIARAVTGSAAPPSASRSKARQLRSGVSRV